MAAVHSKKSVRLKLVWLAHECDRGRARTLWVPARSLCHASSKSAQAGHAATRLLQVKIEPTTLSQTVKKQEQA